MKNKMKKVAEFFSLGAMITLAGALIYAGLGRAQVPTPQPFSPRIVPVSCSAACTTFGSDGSGTLFYQSMQNGFTTVEVDVTSIGGGATLTMEQSNDNISNCALSTNWVSVAGIDSANILPSAVNARSSVGHLLASVSSACFRLRVSAYTSGTVTAGAFLTQPTQALRGSMSGGAAISTPSGGSTLIGVAPAPYPPGAIAITGSATGTTASIAVTLAANATRFTYVCGYKLTADATAATEGNATITGTVTGTLTFRQSVANATNGTAEVRDEFTPCIPSSAVNTAITVNSVAAGTGGNAAGYAWGYQL
jgi:hypothetical protein